jgi:hypothetical protein
MGDLRLEEDRGMDEGKRERDGEEISSSFCPIVKAIVIFSYAGGSQDGIKEKIMICKRRLK